MAFTFVAIDEADYSERAFAESIVRRQRAESVSRTLSFVLVSAIYIWVNPYRIIPGSPYLLSGVIAGLMVAVLIVREVRRGIERARIGASLKDRNVQHWVAVWPRSRPSRHSLAIVGCSSGRWFMASWPPRLEAPLHELESVVGCRITMMGRRPVVAGLALAADQARTLYIVNRAFSRLGPGR
jgi:hypothetical protein